MAETTRPGEIVFSVWPRMADGKWIASKKDQEGVRDASTHDTAAEALRWVAGEAAIEAVVPRG